MMVGARWPDPAGRPPVAAVASWSGPADLTSLTPPDGRHEPTVTPPGCGDVREVCIGVLVPETIVDYLGCTPRQCPDAYRAASPTSHVSGDAAPMFLGAAEVDFVPFRQVEIMAAALDRAGVEVETVEVPGAGHADSLGGELLARTVEFFERHL